MNPSKVVRKLEQGIWLQTNGKYLAIKQYNHPVTGKPTKREQVVDTIEEARHFRLSAQLIQSGQRTSSDTLESGMQLWLASKRNILAKSTYLRYNDAAKRICAIIGHVPLKDITLKLLNDLQGNLSQAYARPTVNSDRVSRRLA